LFGNKVTPIRMRLMAPYEGRSKTL